MGSSKSSDSREHVSWGLEIILKEHGKAIADNKNVAETFNNFFSKIVSNLNIYSKLSDITSQKTTQTLFLQLSRNMLIIQAFEN